MKKLAMVIAIGMVFLLLAGCGRPASNRTEPTLVAKPPTAAPMPPLLSVDPALSARLWQEAEAARQEGNWLRALPLYRQAIGHQRGEAAANAALVLARTLWQAGLTTQTLAYAHYATDIAPGWPEAWTQLAYWSFRTDQRGESLRAARQAIHLDRKQPWSWYILGQWYEREGNTGQALFAYQQVFLANGKIAAVGLRAGHIYVAHHQYEDAIAAYRYGLTAAPDDVNLLWNLALAYEGAGWWAEARSGYQRYLRHDPQGVHAKEASSRLEAISWHQ